MKVILILLINWKKRLQKTSFFTALILGFITFITSLFVVQPIVGFATAIILFSSIIWKTSRYATRLSEDN
jgi:phosphate/sulfate permease